MPYPLIADGNPSAPVYPQDVSTPDDYAPNPKYTDTAVLSIVVTDWQTSSNWLNNRLWVLQWRECQTLYQSPRSSAVFEGSSVTRANVSRFDVARSVKSSPTPSPSKFSLDPMFTRTAHAHGRNCSRSCSTWWASKRR
jgi:hypothetical protein